MDRRRWQEPVDERIVAEGQYLDYRSMLRIERGARLLVAVQAGTLWLTEEGERRDIVLSAGKWHRIRGDGLVIAYALAPAIVTISAPLGVPARWVIDAVAADGRTGPRNAKRKRGNRLVRAAWLKLWRLGARAARRAAQSARQAQLAENVARLAAQLDARTRRDIGLEGVYGGSPYERAESYRWRHEFSSPVHHSLFI